VKVIYFVSHEVERNSKNYVLVRKSFLKASNVIVGGVGMSRVSPFGRSYDAFQSDAILYQASNPCLARCQES
jgi:hypothetical protein